MASKEMTEADLQSVIQSKLTDALNGDESSAFQTAREKALKYYRGDKLGNEVAGRSQVVSRDTAEAVDSILPGLMKIFVGSDKTGMFEARKPDDEKSAEQATDYANWVWLVKNNGAMIAHNWFKDALLYRLGTIKVWWEKQERRRREAYKGLTEDQLVQLELDDTDEIKSLTEYDSVIDNQPVKLTDIVFYRTKEEGCIRIANVAPEDYTVESRAKSDDTTYFAGDRYQVTASDLIEDGYDPEIVRTLPSGNDDWNDEKTDRFAPEEGVDDNGDQGDIDPSMRKIWCAEVYLKVDFDGDGIAEWRKVTVAGPRSSIVILDNEEVDDHPYCTLTPFPTPHKLVGESVVDKVEDIQEVKTALTRGALDNIYTVNQPRLVLGPNADPEDAVNTDIGHPIRVSEGTVGDNVAWNVAPYVADGAFKAIEYFDQRSEVRTGVSRLTQGLDANAINKTATGVNAITNFSNERQAMIARVFAESGVKRLFKKILELSCKYQTQEVMIKLRGEWVSMNPMEWSDEMDFIPTVGIGTGNRDQQLMHLNSLLGIQVQAIQMQGGIEGPLVTGENVYNTAAKIVENAGLKSPELYFTDPRTAPPPQPKPDPEMMKLQQEGQIKQAEMQMEGHFKQQDHQLKVAEVSANIQLKREEAQANLALKAQDTEANRAMKQEQMQGDMALKRDVAVTKAQPQPQIHVGSDGKAVEIMNGADKMTEAAAGVMQLLQAFIQSQAQRDAQQAQRDALQDQQMTALMQMLTAPKEIVRGPDGRPAGVRTVLQ